MRLGRHLFLRTVKALFLSPEVVSRAVDFTLSVRKEDGNIGGFYVSPWTLMAFNKLRQSRYTHIPDLTLARERLIGYSLVRSHAFLNGGDEEQLSRLSLATEGIRILLSVSRDELGEELFWQVWDKSLRLAAVRRERGDIYTVWRACLMVLMERSEWVDHPMYQTLREDLESFQKRDGGWSEGREPVSFVDHTAAVMVALNAVERGFFESRRDPQSGGFRGPGDFLSVESTSWAVMALGMDPLGISFLVNQQQPDGSITTFPNVRDEAKIWPTVSALSAFSGYGF